VSLRRRVVVWFYFQIISVNLHCPRFRIANPDTLCGGNTGSIHVDPRNMPLFDHESNSGMFGRINVEARCLVFIILRQHKFLVQYRIQFRQAHASLYWSNAIKTDHPFMRGGTESDRCEQNMCEQKPGTIHLGILHF
jgi:hypothetical protein